MCTKKSARKADFFVYRFAGMMMQEQRETDMKDRRSNIIRDDLPRHTKVRLEKYAADKVGNNGLDRNREPFTEEEIAIANRIGTPQHEGFSES
ncbi:hypothetical protein A3A38_03955 [Candidatus Kaiserbacteria bacterium RIFCSPLOWO2_01_FULL_53_17]|uniref:Uncharacterized protein n=1 Tax=Candidatus Kaiserbacteria bacterium RIFCSPLOWO2_01_FULL_53_17 TaxID=1798511 RepID=A0A1F6EHZ8_9BACT|nr:MAG: hypothetical protein A3A38_03955 [Candidatus Kaiserbacteria bacterium RIFCSPLOWO2_01_FULL_53_17]